jgi:two-component system OmpR family response regulator
MPLSVRILVVEDDPLVREVIIDMLQDAGYSVLVGCNGAEARPLLDAGSVHMLITDQLMIGEVGEHLADYAQSLGMPALLISGDAASIEGLQEGHHPFLRKPFRLPELQQKVREVLSRNGLKKVG